MMWMEQIKILVWKDLLLEWRRKENFVSMLLFSTVTMLLFQFAVGKDASLFKQLVPGMYWVVFLMAGVLGLNKSLTQEIQNDCLFGIILTPADRGILFLGKMIATALSLSVLQIFNLFLMMIFFDIPFSVITLPLFCVILGGILGFASLGTLLATMTARLQGKEVLLPILLFPLSIPLLLSVVQITTTIFLQTEPQNILSWWKMLISFDVLFLVSSYLAFEFVIES